MPFCWFTSYIGFPNFGAEAGRGRELADAFLTLVDAANDGLTYTQAKGLFPGLDTAQVETKKAAFQEFGLLYVVPRSNEISITALGKQVARLSRQPDENGRMRQILICLAHALARYQFDNPLPVGGNRFTERARATDIRPYLAGYYLLLKLSWITVSELKGAIFGLARMTDLRLLEQTIIDRRMTRQPFPHLESLPRNAGTADNLKIYFMSHLGLDGEMITAGHTDHYGFQEQVFELNETGHEILIQIMEQEWLDWDNPDSPIPAAQSYETMQSYFETGVGQVCEIVDHEVNVNVAEIARDVEGVLDVYDIDNLKKLPHRTFEEGKARFVQHSRLEKTRNAGLIREAKTLFKAENGRLFCEACGFDFEITYGDRGSNYIEAHHKTPISQLEEATEVTVVDLAMVCSNCHRMLHRPPWISVEELIGILEVENND